MPAPTASPAVSSTVGLKNMVIARSPRIPRKVPPTAPCRPSPGRLRLPSPPESADPDVQYADDHEFDTLYPDPEVTFSTSMADIPLAIQR